MDAWVCGPGLEQDTPSTDVVRWLLQQPQRVVLDASALNILAAEPELRRLMQKRQEAGQVTVLTPHAGEFARLAKALNRPDIAEDAGTDQPTAVREAATVWLAEQLHATVLLKGRESIISDGSRAWTVDTGSSWAATAGSGDVLAGILGAVLAGVDQYLPVTHSVVAAVTVHAQAAALAAQLPEGEAPVSASVIADHIRPAVATALRAAGR